MDSSVIHRPCRSGKAPLNEVRLRLPLEKAKLKVFIRSSYWEVKHRQETNFRRGRSIDVVRGKMDLAQSVRLLPAADASKYFQHPPNISTVD